MFSINILCFMSNFSFKGGYSTPVDSMRGDRFIHPPDSLMGGYNITGHRHLFVTDQRKVIQNFAEEETRNFPENIKKVISKFFLERSDTSEFTSTPLTLWTAGTAPYVYKINFRGCNNNIKHSWQVYA